MASQQLGLSENVLYKLNSDRRIISGNEGVDLEKISSRPGMTSQAAFFAFARAWR
jgi:hypothetical protein